jgi:tRNA(fMet)-specific endonuclease VapC
MIKLMLDTNMCIYIIKQKPKKVIDKFRKLSFSEVAISSIVLSELEFGVVKSTQPAQNRLALAQFLAPLEILAYDDIAAFYYGKIRAHLQKMGTPIGSLDLLIAAHTLSVGCSLVTNNESEFQRVPRLKILNWAK